MPNYKYGKADGEEIKRLSEIGGKYVALLNATSEYKTNQ